MTWKDGKLTSASLRSTVTTKVKVIYGSQEKITTLPQNKVWKW